MIKIGLVGLGGMGTVHYSNYTHLDNCEVTAVCESSPGAVQKAEIWGLRHYDNVDDMLNGEELDVADICTPTFLHRELAEKCLSAGKHVICEKPLCLRKADAEALYKLAREKGRLLFVGQVLRFYPGSQILANAVKSGEFGKPLDGQFLRLSACPGWAKEGWLFDKTKSGHLPFDLHIHDLDFMVSMFGKPEKYTFTSCGNEGVGYKEHYRFAYQFSGGLSVSAEAAWFNAKAFPFTAAWRVYFEKAVLESNEKGVVAYPADGEPVVYDIEEKIKIPTGINIPPTGVFLEELGHFLSCIAQNKPSDIVTEEQVMAVLQILEEIAYNA